MVEDVNLVGSRVSVMHLAYDCLGCTDTVAVSITDGKDSDGHRRLVQRPRDCPSCGAAGRFGSRWSRRLPRATR